MGKKIIDNGGPAFPQNMVDMGNGPEDPGPFGLGGMSLRDWFAGKALAGYLAMCAYPECFTPGAGDTAKCAYEYADAMIAEREQAWRS
jgi:hypothetical protein